MTKLNWNKMEPREKDAAIAEHVMGWKQAEFAYLVSFFHPTTDPAACEEVKGKFEHWEVSRLAMGQPEQPDAQFRAKVWSDKAGGYVYGFAPTESECFCKAALRAVGIEVVEESEVEG